MDFIVISCQPFSMDQHIAVYKNGECVEDNNNCKLTDLSQICNDLCKKYNIHQVNFFGSPMFGKQIENSIKDMHLTDYNKFDIEFCYHYKN